MSAKPRLDSRTASSDDATSATTGASLHQPDRPRRRLAWLALLAIALLAVLAAQPAAAQASNPVCAEESGTLVSMIEGFIQITTALGLMGLLVVWQADELASMFAGRQTTEALKHHKRGAIKSGVVLVLLGPLFTVAARVMGLPIAQCVDLVPF